MNYGPLEFAAWLRRSKDAVDSAAGRAADAAAPESSRPNQLVIPSGQRQLTPVARPEGCQAAVVYEAVVMRPPSTPGLPAEVPVRMEITSSPVVLVLSSHEVVRWRLSCVSGS